MSRKVENGDGFESGHDYYDPDMNRAALDEDEKALAAGISERRTMMKIDLRVIPALTVMYFLAFLDRTNIGNANVYGLSTDLGLSSQQYNNCLVMFFVSYCVFEIPSNILLKKFRPSRWLSICMFFFGLVTLCQGFVKSYSGLLATRFFLGVAETGMFPGAFYVISMYYKRQEAQKRYTFFFSSTSLAGAFGGLIAYACGKIKHPLFNSPHKGLEGAWRWVFIIEGAASCLVAFAWYFVIPDFPEDAKWLTEPERAWVKARLITSQGRNGLERKVQPRDILKFFSDFKVYLGALMYFGGIVSAYGYAYFAPTIIKTYGYSPVRTQLFSVPPWAASFVFSNVIAYFSDKFQHRLAFTLIPLSAALCGYAMLLSIHHSRHVEYGALFLATSGTYAALAVIVCWFQVNLGGHTRRAIGSAWQVGFGNLGGIVSVFIFPASDAKHFYKKGYAVSLAFIVVAIAACLAYGAACAFQNRSREKSGVREVSEWDEKELGDMAPTYRYML